MWFVKTQQRTVRGTPDFLCCMDGLFVALELKKSFKEKMKGTLQELVLEKINGANGIALFVFPENWESVKTYLRAINDEVNLGKFNRVNRGRMAYSIPGNIGF